MLRQFKHGYKLIEQKQVKYYNIFFSGVVDSSRSFLGNEQVEYTRRAKLLACGPVQLLHKINEKDFFYHVLTSRLLEPSSVQN